MEPLTALEIEDLIQTLDNPPYDEVNCHTRYDEILERYCIYPDIELYYLIKELIIRVRPKVIFWYE